MLARTLGYKSAMRMLNDLTPEEYERWVLSYCQEPWGDKRQDVRNAITVRWLRWQPKDETDDGSDLPGLMWPHKTPDAPMSPEEQVAAYEALKQTKWKKA